MAQITAVISTMGPSPGCSQAELHLHFLGPLALLCRPLYPLKIWTPPPDPCVNSHGTQAQSKRRTLQEHQACRVRNQACASSPGVTTGLLPRALLRAPFPKPGTSLGPGTGPHQHEEQSGSPMAFTVGARRGSTSSCPAPKRLLWERELLCARQPRPQRQRAH